MTTRRRWHFAALAAAALIAAGCGGGDTDSPLASRVIVFGGSLSDIGTYTPATSLTSTPGAAPYFGGKFTTNTFAEYAPPPAGGTRPPNTSTANIWVEWVAARLGVPITSAEVGFGPTRVPCPAQTSGLAYSCTGYAQGGSLVTGPNGIGKNAGALTIPIVEQIASHNTRAVPGFQTGFTSSDIVFVWAGDNDVFVQFGAASGGAITPAQATAAVQTAATELADLVKNEILAKGAKRVVVMTLVDSSDSPFGDSFGPKGVPAADGARALLQGLSAQFNTTLLAALEGSDAKVFDPRPIIAALRANPSAFGFTNATTEACDPAKISLVTGGRVTDGNPMFCNASPGQPFNGLRAGASASNWVFADDVHPTTGTHKFLADSVWAALKNFGWVPDNL